MKTNPDKTENLGVLTETGAAAASGTTGAGPDPSRLKEGQVIEVRQTRGKADTRTRDPFIWFVATITNVDTARQQIRYQSANRTRVNTGVLDIRDFDVKWVFGHNNTVRFSADRIVEENEKERWDKIEIARAVLNYRHHRDQSGVAGMQWEHIIESSAGGDHSSGNLAHTSAHINNKLGTLFGAPYSSAEAPSGLSGTGGRPLREALRGQPLYVQNRWKRHFYATVFHVSIQWKRSERGIWRALE